MEFIGDTVQDLPVAATRRAMTQAVALDPGPPSHNRDLTHSPSPALESDPDRPHTSDIEESQLTDEYSKSEFCFQKL